MAKNNKKIKKPHSPAGSQIPPVTDQLPAGSFYNDYPRFSLIHIHKKYCLSDCETKEKAAIIDQIHRFSQMTWGEIWDAGKEQMGMEDFPKTRLTALPKIYQDKSKYKVYIFRFSEKGRVIGYHEDDTFHIIWLDRNHEVCDKSKNPKKIR